MNEHIHTHDDGRGLRKICVDGEEVEAVFYADTIAGVVRAYQKPYKVVGDEIESYEVRGSVTVTQL